MFFGNHIKCEAEKFSLQMELMAMRSDLAMTDQQRIRAMRDVKEARDAEARSWARQQLLEAQNQHLISLVRELEEKQR